MDKQDIRNYIGLCKRLHNNTKTMIHDLKVINDNDLVASKYGIYTHEMESINKLMQNNVNLENVYYKYVILKGGGLGEINDIIKQIHKMLPQIEGMLPQIEHMLPQIQTSLNKFNSINPSQIDKIVKMLSKVDISKIAGNVQNLSTTINKAIESQMKTQQAELIKVIKAELTKISNEMKKAK